MYSQKQKNCILWNKQNHVHEIFRIREYLPLVSDDYVVNDNTFEDLLLSLKEQLGKKKYLGVFTF